MKKIFWKYICRYAGIICLILELIAWFLPDIDIYSGEFSATLFLDRGSGQLYKWNMLIWLLWFMLLPFAGRTERIWLIAIAAFGTDLKNRLYFEFARVVPIEDLFTEIGAFLAIYFREYFWQQLYRVCNVLFSLVFLYVMYLPFQWAVDFMKFFQIIPSEKIQEPITWQYCKRCLYNGLKRNLLWVCIIVQIILDPMAYLKVDGAIFHSLHLYPADTAFMEFGWVGGFFILVWVILLILISWRSRLALLALVALGSSMFYGVPFQYPMEIPRDVAALDVNNFPIQAVINWILGGIGQLFWQNLYEIVVYYGGDILIANMIFNFVVLFLIISAIKAIVLWIRRNLPRISLNFKVKK